MIYYILVSDINEAIMETNEQVVSFNSKVINENSIMLREGGLSVSGSYTNNTNNGNNTYSNSNGNNGSSSSSSDGFTQRVHSLELSDGVLRSRLEGMTKDAMEDRRKIVEVGKEIYAAREKIIENGDKIRSNTKMLAALIAKDNA